MRWACVFVAQVFPQWLDDMRKSGMWDMSSEDGLSEQLSRFRRGLLCSAALHARNRIADAALAGYQDSASRVTRSACFELGLWSKYPNLCKGVFSLQEFLKVACQTGTGLPFGIPHVKARSGGSDSDYSYSKFKSKLRRIREIIPVDYVEKLEHFKTCHLEWLAVFLSVPDWRPTTSDTEIFPQEFVGLKNATFNSTAIAVENLRSQLGMSLSTSHSGQFFSEFLTSFLLFKGVLQRTCWRNRNVLEVCLHIDNMLAVTVGGHSPFMIRKKKETSKRITAALKGLGISDLKEPYHCSENTTAKTGGAHVKAAFQTNDEENIPGHDYGLDSFNSSRDLARETELFLYQLVNEDSEFTVLEQRMTFLGCSMESLRSALATWAHLNPNC